MRNTCYRVDDLERFLMASTVATMREMQDHLGTPVTKTVLRKLKALSYRSSYSHGGRYYTLDQIAVYADLSYDLTPGVQIGTGARWYDIDEQWQTAHVRLDAGPQGGEHRQHHDLRHRRRAAPRVDPRRPGSLPADRSLLIMRRTS